MYSLWEWLIAHAGLFLYFESRLLHVSSVSLHLMVMAEKKKGRPSHFCLLKSASEEQVLADELFHLLQSTKTNGLQKYFRNGSSKGR